MCIVFCFLPEHLDFWSQSVHVHATDIDDDNTDGSKDAAEHEHNVQTDNVQPPIMIIGTCVDKLRRVKPC
jgi:hypothetical protein